jgi:hypothetical protein
MSSPELIIERAESEGSQQTSYQSRAKLIADTNKKEVHMGKLIG